MICLTFTQSLPIALVFLFVLGGPASSRIALLFAHLRSSGATSREIVNTRAMVSLSWAAGPPLGTALIGFVGPKSVLGVIEGIAVSSIATVVLMLRGPALTRSASHPVRAEPKDHLPLSRGSSP
ncbi:hypothetical protein ACH3VR_09135 [Microbacterium sp. B2969]|uniref:MFS transporter n=1 Tax=Microbacterium alkaliflavum TaxID=3248839 RepID=A0ABW7Q6M2_9MICO